MAEVRKRLWIEVARHTFTGVGNNATTAITKIAPVAQKFKLESNALTNAEIHGFQIQVHATSGASHKATVKTYDDGGGTYTYHEITEDLNPNLSSTHVVSNPFPIWGDLHFSITDVSGGGGKNYSIIFFVKNME